VGGQQESFFLPPERCAEGIILAQEQKRADGDVFRRAFVSLLEEPRGSLQLVLNDPRKAQLFLGGPIGGEQGEVSDPGKILGGNGSCHRIGGNGGALGRFLGRTVAGEGTCQGQNDGAHGAPPEPSLAGALHPGVVWLVSLE
jgi:hypothetical protein